MVSTVLLILNPRQHFHGENWPLTQVAISTGGPVFTEGNLQRLDGTRLFHGRRSSRKQRLENACTRATKIRTAKNLCR